MTNKERLISLLGFQPSQNSLDGALIDAGITGNVTYDGTNSKVIKGAAIQIMELLITTPNQTNDLGLVISYDRNAILGLIKRYKIEIGDASGEAAIRNKSFMW